MDQKRSARNQRRAHDRDQPERGHQPGGVVEPWCAQVVRDLKGARVNAE
jgi:hypothetical protein